MTTDLFLLGASIGIITVPGNWAGRAILKRLKDSDHRLAIDIMTVALILNFLYLVFR